MHRSIAQWVLLIIIMTITQWVLLSIAQWVLVVEDTKKERGNILAIQDYFLGNLWHFNTLLVIDNAANSVNELILN